MLALTNAIKNTLFLIIIPIVLILIIRQLSEKANEELVSALGFNSQIYVGAIGIIIHELSHLLFAIVFLHHIDAVCLLRIPHVNDPNDRQLGYVKHSWSKNSIYQSIGNAFIGIAPVICSTLILFIILSKWDAPFTLIHQKLVEQVHQSGLSFNLILIGLKYLKQNFQLHVGSMPFTIIELIIITSICFGGFDLSNADLQSGKYALIGLTILVFVISYMVYLLQMQTYFSKILIDWSIWLYLLLAVSILILLLLNIIMIITNLII